MELRRTPYNIVSLALFSWLNSWGIGLFAIENGFFKRKTDSRLTGIGSPIRLSGSPKRLSGTPKRLSGTPKRLSGTPIRRSGSPIRLSGSPIRRSGSPIRRSGSGFSSIGLQNHSFLSLEMKTSTTYFEFAAPEKRAFLNIILTN